MRWHSCPQIIFAVARKKVLKRPESKDCDRFCTNLKVQCFAYGRDCVGDLQRMDDSSPIRIKACSCCSDCSPGDCIVTDEDLVGSLGINAWCQAIMEVAILNHHRWGSCLQKRMKAVSQWPGSYLMLSSKGPTIDDIKRKQKTSAMYVSIYCKRLIIHLHKSLPIAAALRDGWKLIITQLSLLANDYQKVLERTAKVPPGQHLPKHTCWSNWLVNPGLPAQVRYPTTEVPYLQVRLESHWWRLDQQQTEWKQYLLLHCLPRCEDQRRQEWSQLQGLPWSQYTQMLVTPAMERYILTDNGAQSTDCSACSKLK